MKLIIPVLLNCMLVLAVYLADKYTPAKKLSKMAKQIIIGVLFGAVSAFSSSFGVEWLGTIVNVRDAAPLSAGLIFGAPAGIISGLIGGLYRWFSVYWGAGTYTRLACSVATIFAAPHVRRNASPMALKKSQQNRMMVKISSIIFPSFSYSL